jgi:hypothetical protein
MRSTNWCHSNDYEAGNKAVQRLEMLSATAERNAVFGDQEEIKDSTCTAQPARCWKELAARLLLICAHICLTCNQTIPGMMTQYIERRSKCAAVEDARTL